MSNNNRVPTDKKRVDDIHGGAAALEEADKTDMNCPVCNNQEAYYFQMQIRSADEPMTTFFRCTKCSHRWNE